MLPETRQATARSKLGPSTNPLHSNEGRCLSPQIMCKARVGNQSKRHRTHSDEFLHEHTRPSTTTDAKSTNTNTNTNAQTNTTQTYMHVPTPMPDSIWNAPRFRICLCMPHYVGNSKRQASSVIRDATNDRTYNVQRGLARPARTYTRNACD